LTIAEISSHAIQLFQEIMTCLTRSFQNELNASYFGAPCLQLQLRDQMRTYWYRVGWMVEQDAK